MATVIRMRSGRDVWMECARHLLANGEKVAPRGLVTYEDLDVVMIIENPEDALLTGVGRNMNTALASLEALQLIAGICDPQLITKVAPNYKQFIDGGQFHGAYGPRTASQLPFAIGRLAADGDSRQAIVTVWDPVHDLFIEGRHDYPCTVMLQFLIRKSQLVMHVTMRSNDLWWGLTYDMFMFTQLQLAVANALGVDAGPYHHHSISMHFYDRDREAIETMVAAEPVSTIGMTTVGGLGHPDGDPWYKTAERARAIIYGESGIVAYKGVHWHRKQAEKWLGTSTSTG